MIVHPKIRGYICTTAHPLGCQAHVQEQIDYVQSKPAITHGPKKVLIVGASTGYGLSSRVVAGMGSSAATIGVFYEKPAEPKRTATAGWYNSIAYEKLAHQKKLYAKSINGDAFADDVKEQTIDLIKKDLSSIDLFVYSLASPRRVHPKTGVIAKSVLKPIGQNYTNKSIDFEKNEIFDVTLPQATEQEVEQTVSVMGGEDWQLWVEALEQAKLLSPRFSTLAYSYIGPDVTTPVYRNGTIGAAKDHLEKTAVDLNQRLRKQGHAAYVSVNKALVTQSSSAIPFIPLYFVLLMKVMKAKGVHEGCIEQMYRLFSEKIYTDQNIKTDEHSRIRIDDLEMRADVQAEVMRLWSMVATNNVKQLADLKGYQEDFLKLFGFGFKSVDYNAPCQIDLNFS